MNISYSWLKELVDIYLPADELGKALTNIGLAVEGVHRHGDDFVLDLDLTSNRPDCLSHLGVAREINAMTGAHLKPLEQKAGAEVPMPAILAFDVVKIEDPDLCHRFTARIIRNVKIGPSPEWLVKRLEAIGERSINSVADISNYVMHELGQPMHAFDFDKLAEGRIVVRRARRGETITTLDEVERKFDENMLAICDAEKPVAVAGIMGGLDSSITDQTTNVLLEVAYFKRESVRQTSRKLSLATEASYRFERGVDIENLIRASNRATELITELAGGAAGDIIDVYPTRHIPVEVVSRDIAAATKRLTSLDIPTDECRRILESLGIDLKDNVTYISPSWRHDLSIEEDLVEEVARHAGYGNIAIELPPSRGAGEYQATEVRKKLLRQTLVDLGYDEAISYSFIDTKFDGDYEPIPEIVDNTAEEPFVTLRDSVIEGAVRMRPTILPGLLDAVRLNFNHQRRDLGLFEIGKVFASRQTEDGLPVEHELLTMALTGGSMTTGRAMPEREVDFYDAKGAVEAALNAIGVDGASFSAAEVKHLRRGQTASISLNSTVIGYVGRLNDEIAGSYKFRQPVFVAEMNLDAAFEVTSTSITYRPLPKFPSIVRDVSLLANRSITLEQIRQAVAAAHADLCRSVEFVDVYQGKGIADAERSITIRLEYRSDERTLADEDVEAIHQQILNEIDQQLGIRPRV